MLAACFAPLLVATAWIPVRVDQSNVVVALGLVIVVTATGASGRRVAVSVAAVVAALSFTFFDTEPYERFDISRQPDIETAICIFVVGLMTGELALRVARQRRSERSAAGDLGRVHEASSLLAAGEELVVMIAAVAEQLTRTLDLRECSYSTEALPDGMPLVGRDGRLSPGPAGAVALPVWGLGQVLGHFVMRARSALTLLHHDQLLVAVTLADQVGAALAAQTSIPPPDDGQSGPRPPTPQLRVIR